MAGVEANKRLKVEQGNGALEHDDSDSENLLRRLHTLLTSAAGEGLDEVLEELGRLQNTLNGSDLADVAWKAIAGAQEKLQAAIVDLQGAVDRFMPPAGYQPPLAGDEAYVRGLLLYAHRLSYSSAAPLGYQPGQPLYFFKPPAPQEAQIRASQLHAFNRDWEAQQLALQQQAAGAPAPSAPSQAQAVPAPAPGASDLAAMAARHGLDVQQLLASMPAGWKPGDPVSLVPTAAVGLPAAAAKTATAAPLAPAAAAPAAAATPQRDVSPVEERVLVAAAPLLTGIFLDDFGQYDYDVSSEEGGEGGSSEDSGSD